MRPSRAATCAALFALFWNAATIAPAQDVVLTSRDGQIEISGTLLGFDGEFYRVDTDYGELTVDGSGVLCDGPGCPNLQEYVAKVSFSGAETLGRLLLPALFEAFAQKNGYLFEREVLDETHLKITLRHRHDNTKLAEFSIRLTNTDEGFADLLAQEADIVLALREIRADEHRRAYEAGMGDMSGPHRSRVLALDALVPVVAPGNPVRSISPGDLAAVFAGQISNWSSLGGPDAPVTAYALDTSAGLAQAMEDLLMGPISLQIAESVVRHSRVTDLAQAIEEDPFGIALVSFAEVGNGQSLSLKGACGRTLRVTRRTVKTEDYPLTAPMFLYLPARRLPKVAREFLAYSRSPAAQGVVRRMGFVDQATEQIPVELQGDRFANAVLSAGEEVSLDELKRMAETLTPMRRLTLSFRFDAGSAQLDAQSKSNVQYLARSLEQGRYDGKQLVFVGFSDGDGPAASNKAIAMRRAEAALRAVLDAAETADLSQLDMTVEAFGEAMPLACDDSAWGRKANRRVEVWLR